MAPKKQKAIVSIRELAKETGLSPSVLYGQARNGKLPGARKMGKRIIVHLETFMTTFFGIEACKDAPEPGPQSLAQSALEEATRENARPEPDYASISRDLEDAQGRLLAEAVQAQLRTPKKIEERTNQEPLQPWTELPENKPLVSSGKFQYYNHLSTRTVPSEIIDRIQDLRSKGHKPRQILASMRHDANIAKLQGLNPPPVPRMNPVSRYAKEFDAHGSRSLKRTQEMVEPEVPEAKPLGRQVSPAIGNDAKTWPDIDDGREFFRIGDQSEHNVGDAVRLSLREAFTCANCKEVKERQEKLALSVCRPGRRDIEKDIVSFALCSTKCAKEFIDQKDEAEWLNTPIGRQRTTEELKAEGWIEVPTFSTTESTETSGSLWRKLRNLVDGNE